MFKSDRAWNESKSQLIKRNRCEFKCKYCLGKLCKLIISGLQKWHKFYAIWIDLHNFARSWTVFQNIICNHFTIRSYIPHWNVPHTPHIWPLYWLWYVMYCTVFTKCWWSLVNLCNYCLFLQYLNRCWFFL